MFEQAERGEATRFVSMMVGQRLRDFRLKRRLTLSEVAQRSGNEFKISALGAYERGERSISVVRLERLAAVYGTDVPTLLGLSAEHEIDLPALERREERDGIVVDLSRLRVFAEHRAPALLAFAGAINRLRGEMSSSVLVVRRSDAAFLAAAVGCDPGTIDEALEALASSEPTPSPRPPLLCAT